jgi:hypothetical protein
MLFGDFEDRTEQSIPLPEETSEKFHHLMFHAILPTLAGCIWRFSEANNM